MKIQHFVVMISLLIFSSSAFAYRCVIDMRKIDEVLSRQPAITETQAQEIRKLRAEGEALHNRGKHKESVETLHKALGMLGVR